MEVLAIELREAYSLGGGANNLGRPVAVPCDDVPEAERYLEVESREVTVSGR